MGDGRWDLARQVANVVGALFQVAMAVVASAGIQEVVERGPGSLVEPAAGPGSPSRRLKQALEV